MNYALIIAGLSSGLLVQPVFSQEQPLTAPPVGDVPAPAQSNKLDAAPAPLIPVAPAPSKKASTSEKKTTTTAKKSATEKKAAASSAAKKADTKAKADESLTAVPLTPGLATARQDNINVRGQAAINSEIVTKLKKGQQVTVLEEVTKKPKPDEPSKWAKVTLPSGTMVWVHSSFIDSATKTVKVKKLNMRSGPGENYSVVGLLEKGATITEVEKKGDWTKIEAPASSYGFVASHLLINTAPEKPVIASVEPPKTPATTVKPPEPAPVPTEVAIVNPTPAPPVATEPPTTVSPGVPPTVTAPPEVTTPAPAPVPTTPPIDIVLPTPVPATPPPVVEEEEKEEPLIKRIISREGIVKRSVSIQAPSFFALESLENGKTINYLYSTSTNLVLKDFWNQRVMVTGEEQLDERWPNTPVIYVESLKTVE